MGDIGYQAQRRSWIQTASRAGVKAFGYLFTQPQPNGDPALGGTTSYSNRMTFCTLMSLIVPHESEISFVYGAPNDSTLSSARLSKTMIDYWVSFATSLDPNDGRGNDRESIYSHSAQLLPFDPVLLKVLYGPSTHQIAKKYFN